MWQCSSDQQNETEAAFTVPVSVGAAPGSTACRRSSGDVNADWGSEYTCCRLVSYTLEQKTHNMSTGRSATTMHCPSAACLSTWHRWLNTMCINPFLSPIHTKIHHPHIILWSRQTQPWKSKSGEEWNTCTFWYLVVFLMQTKRLRKTIALGLHAPDEGETVCIKSNIMCAQVVRTCHCSRAILQQTKSFGMYRCVH